MLTHLLKLMHFMEKSCHILMIVYNMRRVLELDLEQRTRESIDLRNFVLNFWSLVFRYKHHQIVEPKFCAKPEMNQYLLQFQS